MFKKLGEDKKIDKLIFWVVAIMAISLVICGIIFPEFTEVILNNIVSFLSLEFSWLYISSVSIFLFVLIGIAFSKYGKIKLGKDDDVPEYSALSWFAMLFSSGMGISLIFWCVAEPVKHLMTPLSGAESGSTQAVADAMQLVFYHWGLHPWSIFGVVGLALAYCQYRKGMPAMFSSTLYPLIGQKGVKDWRGKTVDIIATFSTLFGVAVSLGLGSLQMNAGLNQVFGIEQTTAVTVAIIIIVTIIYTITAASGIEKGIKFFSNLNMILMLVLLGFVFVMGPTRYILDILVNSTGLLVQNFFEMSFFTDPSKETGPWLSTWTIFYWSWWISCAPPLGGFIARISKGRTVREFIAGVLLAPTILSFIWMSTFGGSAINLQQNGVDLSAVVEKDVTAALFTFLQQFPLSSVMSVVAIVLIGTFFITSANSSTFVMGMFSSKGDLNPSKPVKCFWGILMGAISAVMLMAGGLDSLQNSPIVATFPFLLIILLIVVALFKMLKSDKMFDKQENKEMETEEINILG